MRRYLPLLLLLFFLAACVPPVTEGNQLEAGELERTATIAWHRMQAVFLKTGEYNTSALREVALPRGARWDLEQLEPADYRLKFSSSLVEDFVWYVTPQGVRRARA